MRVHSQGWAIRGLQSEPIKIAQSGAHNPLICGFNSNVLPKSTRNTCCHTEILFLTGHRKNNWYVSMSPQVPVIATPCRAISTKQAQKITVCYRDQLTPIYSWLSCVLLRIDARAKSYHCPNQQSHEHLGHLPLTYTERHLS